MAEFNSNGEVKFKEGYQSGYILSIEELGDRQDALKQTGLLVFQFFKGVPKSSRAKVLQETCYTLGVASTFLDGEYKENPEYVVWIEDTNFKVSRRRDRDPQKSNENYSLSNGTHKTELTVWDHDLTPPLVQKVPLKQAQEVMDASNEIYKPTLYLPENG